MNPKISGQSSKSNYKNNGSSASAVFYNEHDLREYLDEALELGARDKQMQFFDMEGNIVTAAEVLDKVDRHHSGLHKDDAKFYCIMLDPSDPEIAAMGADLTERLSNGQQYVFDVMDAYAKNFNREGIEDRHNLTAYAIPHLYKGEEKKDQLHWHIIVARKDASNKYKLSPLTNHRSTTKGVVKGGFDRVAFDRECEQLFDKRFGYKRKVEESFDYCLAQKKGTPEQKAEQTQRLADQNKPDLEAAFNAFLNQRLAQLAAEAAAKAEKERQEKEEAARKEAARLDRTRRNEFWNDYHSKYRPEYNKLKDACNKSFELYKTAKDNYGVCSAAITEKYNNLRNVYSQMNTLQDDVQKASTAKGIVKAVSALVFFINPVAGIIMGLVGSTIAEAERSAAIAARKDLRAQAAAIKDSIEGLKAEQAALRQDKADRLKVYVENKEAKTALQTEINNLKAELNKPEPKEQAMKAIMEGYAQHVAEKKQATSLKAGLAAYARKSEILSVFKDSKDAASLRRNLADHGLSFREIKSARGVEDITITASGDTPFEMNIGKFGTDFHHQILEQLARATNQKPAYKTAQEIDRAQRVRMARNATQNAMQIRAAQEAARQEAQRKAAEEAQRLAAQRQAAQEATKQEAQRRAMQENQSKSVVTNNKGTGGQHF